MSIFSAVLSKKYLVKLVLASTGEKLEMVGLLQVHVSPNNFEKTLVSPE